MRVRLLFSMAAAALCAWLIAGTLFYSVSADTSDFSDHAQPKPDLPSVAASTQLSATAAVTAIIPSVVYNNKDRPITIQFSGSSEVDHFELFNASATIALTGTKTTAPPKDSRVDTKFDATLLSGFQPGAYFVRATTKENVRVESALTLTVKPAINASISDIAPKRVKIPLDTETRFTLTGSNLAAAQGCKGSCSFISMTDSAVIVNVNSCDSANDCKVSLRFPDDSEASSPEIELVPRVFPWDASSWQGLLALMGAFMFVGFLHYSINKQTFAEHIQNKTAPTLINILIGDAVLLVVACAISAPVATTRAGQFGWVAMLAGVNVMQLVIFADVDYRFGAFRSARTVIAFVLGLLALTLAAPFVLSNLLVTVNVGTATAAVELLAGITIVVIGLIALEFRRRELLSARQTGPSDEEVLLRVEGTLYRKGSADAQEDLKDLPADQISRVMAKYYTDARESHAMNYDPALQRISLERAETIGTVAAAFESARAALGQGDVTSDPLSVPAYSELVDKLASSMGFQVNADQPPYATASFIAKAATPTRLESVLPPVLPLVLFPSTQVISPTQLKELQQLQNQLDVKNRIAVLSALNQPVATREQIQKELTGFARENIVVLGERDWTDILSSKDELTLAFMRLVQQQIDLTILSPYQERAPTRLDMFYGRTQEIGTVVEAIDHASIALLGARRIGKTSVLHAVQRVLEARGKSLLYLDCYYIDNYQALFSEISDRWKDLLKGMTDKSEVSDFARSVRQLKGQAPDTQLVFQLDEVDRLLHYDLTQNRETLFRMFRALAQQHDCQFIYSGERTLLTQIANPSSPFFNFAIPLSLGLLEREHAYALVAQPMQLIGVSLREHDAILTEIFEQTSGHPNLIQYLCAQLLTELSTAKTREITLELVQQVSRKSAYRDRYLETFWSQANPLEKIISIYIAEHEGGRPQRDIFEFLQGQGIEASIDQVSGGLRYLLLSQLLDERDGVYSIKARQFNECIATQAPEQWIREQASTWREFRRGSGGR
jgi:hypothetical protein